MGRGGYNAPAQSTKPSHPVPGRACTSVLPDLPSMQGRGGYNDVHSDDDQITLESQPESVGIY
jgi:hypothetical protein